MGDYSLVSGIAALRCGGSDADMARMLRAYCTVAVGVEWHDEECTEQLLSVPENLPHGIDVILQFSLTGR